MKRSLFTAGVAILLSGTLLAGGIVTNTNQSAMYTRMVARQATLGIDAVYFNPAGLTKLENGLHFSINSQTIGQNRTITSSYVPPLNDGKYEGEVFAPVFPSVYGAFKLGKLAISAGFNVIGGGGGAEYTRGLPSFEYSPSDLPSALTLQGQNVTDYRLETEFTGSSNFFGYQANVSYEINDMISVAFGARYVTAKETYEGYLRNIDLYFADNPPGSEWVGADDFFTGVAGQYTSAATNATGGSAAVQSEITAPPDLLNPLTNATAIAVLTGFGYPAPAIAAMNNATAIGTLDVIAASSTASAGKNTITATLLGDQTADAVKKGSGITPIISVNIQPIEMLNIAVKYEFLTKLSLTHETESDVTTAFDTATSSFVTMFPDGLELRMDMPAVLTVGATLRPIDPLLLSAGLSYFFDQDAVWETINSKTGEITNKVDHLSSNSWDMAIGAEYGINENLLVSAGYSMTRTGATEDYQSALSYSLSTNGISFGLGYNIMENIQLNVGGQYVIYGSADKTFDHDFAGTGTLLPITEKFEKSVWIVAAGLNISLAR